MPVASVTVWNTRRFYDLGHEFQDLKSKGFVSVADQKSHKQRNMSGICRKKKGIKEIKKLKKWK